MLFNTLDFLIFFILVTLLFYSLPHKYRWIHLLLASSFFYMYFVPQYIFILFSIILVDYFLAIKIENAIISKKKTFLIISIAATCLLLFIFKYLNFFNQNIIYLSYIFGFNYSEREVGLLLPIGLSFHTFQSLSYVIEVYRGNFKAEKHLGIYALYVMFYPQLVTGPIERPQQLLVQLRNENSLIISNVSNGLRLILYGLFVKMVVADNLAEYVDQIYKDPSSYNSISIMIGLFLYSFQIYGDFLGYSTIAVGCATVMGYSLMDNFKSPYFSKRLSEFWQRWHISLSSWFRDYIYITLGGNKVNVKRWMVIVLLVFSLSGIWHGANWTFVVWGILHGLFYIIEKRMQHIIPFTKNKNKLIVYLLNTFNSIKIFLLVTLLWVFFRASDMQQVGLIFHSIFNNYGLENFLNIDPNTIIFLGLFLLLEFLLYKRRFDKYCSERHLVVRWTIYSLLIFIIIVFSSVGNTPFIYFQF